VANEASTSSMQVLEYRGYRYWYNVDTNTGELWITVLIHRSLLCCCIMNACLMTLSQRLGQLSAIAKFRSKKFRF
jgi:hypothetical protein